VPLAGAVGVIITLAVLLPAEVGEKADLLKPAPEGIKPEWYFLFMFKTLKMVPETLGVTLFALAALFLLAIPFVDRRAARGAPQSPSDGRVRALARVRGDV